MDELQVITAISKSRTGIRQYLEIMSLLPFVDVSKDRNFQRKYNAFYRVRQRPANWYHVYFSFLENCKQMPPSFDTTLQYLFTMLNRIEPSFSSKLVVTLDPNQPVWDQFVLNNTGQIAPRYGERDRIEKLKIIYRKIQEWYRIFLSSSEGQDVVRIFNREVQENERITDLKKIDFVLWQIRA